MSTKAYNPSAVLHGIAETFPCLRGSITEACFCQGRFYPGDLARNMRYWGHGEQQAARFLLTLWNPSFAKKRNCLFDPTEALAVWDMGNREAYVAWCKNPIYP